MKEKVVHLLHRHHRISSQRFGPIMDSEVSMASMVKVKQTRSEAGK
jgi:hypothetical protein